MYEISYNKTEDPRKGENNAVYNNKKPTANYTGDLETLWLANQPDAKALPNRGLGIPTQGIPRDFSRIRMME